MLRSQDTRSGDARELAVAARGVTASDQRAFEAQGFHVIVPAGARFFPDVPNVVDELTADDGSLKDAKAEQAPS